MEHEKTAFGFTSLVLGAVAHVGLSDVKVIRQAIIAVKLSDIEEWSEREIGRSIQSQRRQMKKIIVDLKTKVVQEFAGVLERKVMGFSAIRFSPAQA